MKVYNFSDIDDYILIKKDNLYYIAVQPNNFEYHIIG